MKKSIPLTGSTTAVTTDPSYERFNASLRKQLLKVARTHPVESTRALFQSMADGNMMPRSGPKERPQPAAPPVAAPPPTPVAKAPEPRRAPPARPVHRRPSALAK